MKFLYLFAIFFQITIHSQICSIYGKVTDSRTNEPLVGANILVNELKNHGCSSDSTGFFKLKVPAGSYSIKVTLIGYSPIMKTDIIAKTGKDVMLNIQLSETTYLYDDISIKPDYFDKSKSENNLSTILLSAEEVKRSPGSLQDFQRILQSLAGVSFSKDKTNELLVRGGSPDENLVILDNMEIHSTNHFPNEFNSGGPINMINVNLIDNVSFSTGGFISKYGNKLSSVMNITTRDGITGKLFKANFNISNMGIGTILEGDINEGKGSWLLSVRKSYLDLIKNAIRLTSVPEYYDIQFKVDYAISQNHKIICSGIYGNDKIISEINTENNNLLLAGTSDSITLYKDDINQKQYVVGLTLNSTWFDKLFSLFTIYYNSYQYDNSEEEVFTKRDYNNEGEVFSSQILNKSIVYKDINLISSLAFKFEFVWNISKTNQLELGGSIKSDNFSRSLITSGDLFRYDILLNGWNTPDDIYILQSTSYSDFHLKLLDCFKSYAYFNEKINFWDNSLILNIGLRFDDFTYSSKQNFSPRISLTYNIFNNIGELNFAYGEYYQTQNYSTYNDRNNSNINKNLKNSHARHFVFGYNCILDEGLKLTLEGYLKKYSDLPVKESLINYKDRTFRSERLLNLGKQTTYGLDLLIQQKLVTDFYSTVSFSYMWSKMNDPREGMKDKHYSSDYEYPYIFTIIAGKRFSSLRDKLDKAPFFLNYLSYLLPFSNDMEISAKWRYASGRPYTPYYFVTSEQFFEGELKWSKGNWITIDERNSARYPSYHKLDISISSRFNFSNWSLSVYFSVENVYNRKNVASYHYNSDGTIETKYQYSIFPVIGIDIDF